MILIKVGCRLIEVNGVVFELLVIHVDGRKNILFIHVHVYTYSND